MPQLTVLSPQDLPWSNFGHDQLGLRKPTALAARNSQNTTQFSTSTSTSSSKEQLSFVPLNQVKKMILESLGNKSKDVSIVVGVVTPNGTAVSGYGNISKANSTRVNGDTIFNIGSIMN